MSAEYRRGLCDAARIAEMWATENYRLAADTVALSPVLQHLDISPAAMQREAALAELGAMYASRANAADDIAAAILEAAQ